MIDTHCHILPELDDGPESLESSLAVARAAAEDGVTGVIATPHYITGLYEPNIADIRKALAELDRHLKKSGLNLALYPGCEAALELDLPRRCRSGLVLTLADKGRHLLVELPAGEIPPWAEEVLYQLQLARLTPIIAHPERNIGIQHDPGWLAEMVERGILFQITAASLTGHFGQAVQRLAVILVKNRLVHLVATDAHSTGGRRPRLTPARRVLEQMLTDEAVSWLLDDNPTRTVEGRAITPYNGRWLRRKAWWSRLMTKDL